MSTSASRRLLAPGLAAGIAAPILSWGLSIAVAATWPGYDPVAESISLLVHAPNGWLQTVAFAMSGALGAAWAVALPTVLGATPRERLVVRALLLAEAAITLGFALFPTDPVRGTTTVGRIHLVVFGAYVIVTPIALAVIGRVMRRDPRWRAAARPSLAAAGALVLSAVLVPFTLDGMLTPWLGLLERAYVAIPSIWQAMVGILAWRLFRRAAS